MSAGKTYRVDADLLGLPGLEDGLVIDSVVGQVNPTWVGAFGPEHLLVTGVEAHPTVTVIVLQSKPGGGNWNEVGGVRVVDLGGQLLYPAWGVMADESTCVTVEGHKIKHFAVFFSPGTFMPEQSSREIDAPDIKKAAAMADEIVDMWVVIENRNSWSSARTTCC